MVGVQHEKQSLAACFLIHLLLPQHPPSTLNNSKLNTIDSLVFVSDSQVSFFFWWNDSEVSVPYVLINNKFKTFFGNSNKLKTKKRKKEKKFVFIIVRVKYIFNSLFFSNFFKTVTYNFTRYI